MEFPWRCRPQQKIKTTFPIEQIVQFEKKMFWTPNNFQTFYKNQCVIEVDAMCDRSRCILNT